MNNQKQEQRKEEPVLPLYKRLSENIINEGFGFDWSYSPINDDGAIVSEGNGFIMESPTNSIGKYTVLAVNNLHILAAKLEKLINLATETTKNLIGFDGAYELDDAIDEAKEALSNIS